MIRAYHDPALRHSVTRDGSWGRALEFVCAPNQGRTKSIYVHNRYPATMPMRFNAEVPGFAVNAPASINLKPGVTRVDVSLEAGDLPRPLAVDFLIAGKTLEHIGSVGHPVDPYTGVDYTQEPGVQGGSVFRAEASAFVLPSGDERFGEHGQSPLRSTAALTEYVASGMGFVDESFKRQMVAFVTEHTRDSALWALNKHYAFDPRYASMSDVRTRALSIGYDPPGIPGLHPYLRRRVYARAWHIARRIGSADGIRMVYASMGIPLKELRVYREGFTWYIRVPKWVANAYSTAFLGNLALYHVDPYMVVNVGVHQETLDSEYSNIDFTIAPGPSVAPPITPPAPTGILLTEDGAYLVTEDEQRMKLEEPFWWPEGLEE